ncbi:hypothetical protein MTO96_004072 [Rhipicephalus appendiculatus]
MNEILTNPDHDQLMPTVQSWMNELAQLMRERESRLAEFTREVAAPAEPERGQVAAAAAPKMEYQHRTRTRSETMEDFSAAASLGLPRPPFFENLPPDVLDAMRPTTPHEYPQHAFSDRRLQGVKCILYLTAPLSSTFSWMENHVPARYQLTLRDCDADVPANGENTVFARVTVLHTIDAYFTVEVSMNVQFLFVQIEFHGAQGYSRCSMPSLRVKMFDGQPTNGHELPSYQEPCPCKRGGDHLLHFRSNYSVQIDFLRKKGLLRDRKMQFEIELSHNETARFVTLEHIAQVFSHCWAFLFDHHMSI